MRRPTNWQTEIENLGFAAIPKVLTDDEVEQCIGALQEAPLSRSKAGIRHALTHTSLRPIAHQPRLVEIARSILGPGAFPFRATVFDKSPTSNWLVVWHQDTALPLVERVDVAGWGPWSIKAGITYAHAPASALEHILALRIHLDDSTSENGPLRVLPATHQAGVLDDDEIKARVHRIPAVECVVQRGGVLAMKPLLVHSSSKSRGTIPRRVLHIEYAASRTLDRGLELAIA